MKAQNYCYTTYFCPFFYRGLHHLMWMDILLLHNFLVWPIDPFEYEYSQPTRSMASIGCTV